MVNEERTLPITDDLSSLAYLEIQSGQTNFPCRPIDNERFLIGAGSNCQLQLGGDDIPMIHTIISQEADGIQYQALVSTPELTINGAPSQQGVLEEGDEIQIDCFKFIIRNTNHSSLEKTPENSDQVIGKDPIDIESLSASDLIDLIEEEQAMIEDFDSQQLGAAAALMQAVANFLPENESADHSYLDDQSLNEASVEVSEPELLKKELTDLALQLEQQAKSLQQREEFCEANMDSLIQSQQQLAQQLEATLVHIEQIKTLQSEEEEQRRRSA